MCIFRYTPISDPDSKGYFDLMIKVCHSDYICSWLWSDKVMILNLHFLYRFIMKGKWANILINSSRVMWWKYKGKPVNQTSIILLMKLCIWLTKCIFLRRPIEKFRYTPNMKKHIGMVSAILQFLLSSTKRICIVVCKMLYLSRLQVGQESLQCFRLLRPFLRIQMIIPK